MTPSDASFSISVIGDFGPTVEQALEPLQELGVTVADLAGASSMPAGPRPDLTCVSYVPVECAARKLRETNERLLRMRCTLDANSSCYTAASA